MICVFGRRGPVRCLPRALAAAQGRNPRQVQQRAALRCRAARRAVPAGEFSGEDWVVVLIVVRAICLPSPQFRNTRIEFVGCHLVRLLGRSVFA